MKPPKNQPAARVGVEHPAVAWVTVLFILVVAAASFSISFASISALGELMLVPEPLRPAVPLAIDASLLAFTAAATLFHSRGERRATRWSWFLVGAATILSVGANIAHVLLPQGITTSSIVGAVLAASMPLLLLGATHVGVLALVAPSNDLEGTGAQLLDLAEEKTETAETAPTDPAVVVVSDLIPNAAHVAPEPFPAPQPVPAAPAAPEIAAPVPVPQPSEALAATLPTAAKQPTTTKLSKPRKPSTKPAPRPIARSAGQAPKPRPLEDADLPTILALTAEGQSRQKVADALNVSKSAVTRAIALHEAKAAA